jgi:2-dehydropantoate 2-reductase
LVAPLLNGMRHLDVLDQRLGRSHVLGGTCLISARLDDAGRIVHLNDIHSLSFGARVDGQLPKVEAIGAAMAGVKFKARASSEILLEMWEKWVFLATMAGINCLMRGTNGDVAAAGGGDLALSLLEECRSIAAAAGWAPRETFLEKARPRLADANSTLSASMLGDLERGGPTEADHILGDLLRRRPEAPAEDRSMLRIAYTALKTAEARTARERV